MLFDGVDVNSGIKTQDVVMMGTNGEGCSSAVGESSQRKGNRVRQFTYTS